MGEGEKEFGASSDQTKRDSTLGPLDLSPPSAKASA